MKLIKSTPNGQITYCPCTKRFGLEFGNLYLFFDAEELRSFNNYLQSIDYKHYLTANEDACNKRKLMLIIGASDIYLCLHANEFLELRELVSLKKTAGIISNKEVINHEIICN